MDPQGYALGPLAVAAVEPQAFSAAQRDILRNLSTLVVTAL